MGLHRRRHYTQRGLTAPENPRLAQAAALLSAGDHQHAASAARALLAGLRDHELQDKADANYILGLALALSNDSQHALEAFEAAGEFAAACGNTEWALRAQAEMARVNERIGNFDLCEHLALRVIDAARQAGFAFTLHYSELILAYCHQRRRDYAAAEPLFESAEPYFQRTRDEALLLRCWEGLAWIWNATGRRAQGRELEARIVSLQRSRRDPIALAISLTAVGFGAWIDGDIERMRSLMEETLTIVSAHKHERLLMSTHNNLAMACVELGEWDAVKRHAALALLHAGRSGDHRRPPLAYGLQMHLALYESRPGDAVHFADEAVFALRERSTLEAQQFIRWRPVAHLAAGDLARARDMWEGAPPAEVSLEQIIQMRWLRRTLNFLQSSRFRPTPPLSQECLSLAAAWEAAAVQWLSTAQTADLPERWRGP